MSGRFTQVELAHWPDLVSDWLRFGAVAESRIIDRRRSIALLPAGALFAFVRWRGGDHGTILWRLWVLCAGKTGDALATINGVHPGAMILLAVSGPPKVKRALALIDAIEAEGIDPADVAPSWWRVAHNRLAANREVRPYGRQEHAADLDLRRIAP